MNVGCEQPSAQEDRIRELEATVKRLEDQISLFQQQQPKDTFQSPSETRRNTTTPIGIGVNSGAAQATANVGKEQQEQEQKVVSSSSSFTGLLKQREDVERYSRQLLLADGGFGVAGQLRLGQSSVLVVGAGGIGSTLLLYLGAAGVGRLIIVDMDVVHVSNLHRQVIHNVQNLKVNKAVSARQAVLRLNPTIACVAIETALTAENALSLVQDCDCVVDATDNPATRYLINDACVLAGKPLVSGSAVGTQGQITVYNWKDGPCYRCLYPNPAIQAECRSCSDAGVLGPVPGLIGILQAMEALKVLTGFGSTLHDRLLMYDGGSTSFLNVKKPTKAKHCPVCSSQPSIRSMRDSQNNLRDTRGPSETRVPHCITRLPPPPNVPNVTCQEYYRLREEQQQEPHILLDVRVEQQFDLCALPGAVNIPLEKLPHAMDRIGTLSQEGTLPIYCLCRRGIASIEAVQIILSWHNNQSSSNNNNNNGTTGTTTTGPYNNNNNKGDDDASSSSSSSRAGQPPQWGKIPSVYNIEGGLVAWQAHVDPFFPNY